MLPLRWLIAAFLAAAFHELCHIFAVILCGGRVKSLQIGGRGAVISAGRMSTAKNIYCILSGPMGSLLLLPFAPWIPRIAICGLFQGLFNLLPIYPLDGGRALRCILYGLKNRP
jgi:stage IV sporulation protein FB